MNVNVHICAALVLAAALAGCKGDPAPEPDLGTDHYPLKLGSWVEYQVDSAWRDDPLNIRDTISYRLRVTVQESYLDGGGRLAYRLLRSVRNADGDWQVRDVWTTTAGNAGAEMTEENKRRLKLSFPVRLARAWDINVYNTDRALDVAYREVDEPWSYDTLYFARTCLLRNVLPPNAVERRNYEERYARGLGMVEKYWEETNTQFDPTTQQFVVRGFRLDMKAVGYGGY